MAKNTAYPSPAPGTGGQVANATSTAVQITSVFTPCVAVQVQNDPGSPVAAQVGGVGSQPIVIPPGASETLEVVDASTVYVKSSSLSQNVTINWLSRK